MGYIYGEFTLSLLDLQFSNTPLVRRVSRLLGLPSVCLCCISCQVDRSDTEDGVPGHYDVPASLTDSELG